VVIAAASRVFYRSCNFCASVRYEVFHRVSIRFPERIYGDRELSDPSIGEILNLQYLQCAECGLVAINPLPHFRDIDCRSFDGERNIVAWTDTDYGFYEEDKLRTIASIYENYRLESFRKNGRVLDVSSGPGVSLSWLRDEHRWEIHGTDPDLYAQRVARERYGVEITNGLLPDIEARDDHFDLLLMDNSLEHTFDPLTTLIECFRVLRPGGGLFIAVPNCDGLATRLINLNAHWGHWFLFSPRVLCRMLQRIGFRVTTVFARQLQIRPELVELGVDIEEHRAALDVALWGEKEVGQIETMPSVSDYFHVLVEKPEAATRSSPEAPLLRQIASSSLVERDRVDIY
jgi:SAM-dependent methyltransferase